jgi:hypothetical protein
MTDLITQYGPTAGTVAAIFLFLKYITSLNKSQTRRDDLFAKALDKNTDAMKAVAKSNDKQAKEAEKRNGHLAEIAVENKNSNFTQNQAILTAITNLKSQHIGTQVVDKQTVKKEK